jgi:mannose-1-phosphate guanylyltransferase
MQSRPNHKNRWGVILSGGDGVRLRPLTRLLTGDDRPKQFCKVVGEETLLAQTRHRIAPVVRPDRTIFVLSRAHEPFYNAELIGVPRGRMVVQSRNRGTLPAILWSLMRVMRLNPRAIVGFFPSDHHYSSETKFVEKVEFAFAAAEVASRVILLGAAATAPEVEYGWIEPQFIAADGNLTLVRRFWEKPSSEIAQTLLSRGCLWNTFVMVGRAQAFLELIQSVEPDLYETFQRAIEYGRADMNAELMEGVYDRIETGDFSKRVLARNTDRLAVLNLGDIGWDDLGEPRRVNSLLSQDQARFTPEPEVFAASAG